MKRLYVWHSHNEVLQLGLGPAIHTVRVTLVTYFVWEVLILMGYLWWYIMLLCLPVDCRSWVVVDGGVVSHCVPCKFGWKVALVLSCLSLGISCGILGVLGDSEKSGVRHTLFSFTFYF